MCMTRSQTINTKEKKHVGFTQGCYGKRHPFLRNVGKFTAERAVMRNAEIKTQGYSKIARAHI